MVTPTETSPAEIAVDYTKPLDQMSDAERTIALEHGRQDTKLHIDAERQLAHQNHEGLIGAVLHANK